MMWTLLHHVLKPSVKLTWMENSINLRPSLRSAADQYQHWWKMCLCVLQVLAFYSLYEQCEQAVETSENWLKVQAPPASEPEPLKVQLDRCRVSPNCLQQDPQFSNGELLFFLSIHNFLFYFLSVNLFHFCLLSCIFFSQQFSVSILLICFPTWRTSSLSFNLSFKNRTTQPKTAL